MSTTRKRVKVVGTETYIKQDTGELREMQVIDIEERDANFHKLWLGHILQSIDLIGNQKTRLAFWILDHLDSNNLLIMTQRQIADKTGIARGTITTTLKALIDSNFLIMRQAGVYRGAAAEGNGSNDSTADEEEKYTDTHQSIDFTEARKGA